MQSYTYQADELYSQAGKVKILDDICPYSSCYESLLEQEQILDSAREMEANAREIRNQFQAIADFGFPIPTSTLLRKAVVSVKKGKMMFSTEQLSRVVALIMQNMPYLLFRPKTQNKEYIVLIFWATSFDDSCYAIQQKAEVIKQEVSVDDYKLRFKVENITAPRRFMLYTINNYVSITIQNDDECHLPPEDHNQLSEFVTLLQNQNIVEPKKRKLEE